MDRHNPDSLSAAEAYHEKATEQGESLAVLLGQLGVQLAVASGNVSEHVFTECAERGVVVVGDVGRRCTRFLAAALDTTAVEDLPEVLLATLDTCNKRSSFDTCFTWPQAAPTHTACNPQEKPWLGNPSSPLPAGSTALGRMHGVPHCQPQGAQAPQFEASTARLHTSAYNTNCLSSSAGSYEAAALELQGSLGCDLGT